MTPDNFGKDKGLIDFWIIRETETALREVSLRIPDTQYILSVPLTSFGCELESEGKRVYSGTVSPGMLRLSSPGEQLRSIVKSSCEIVQIALPILRFTDLLSDTAPTRSGDGHIHLDPLLHPVREVITLSRVLRPALSFDVGNRDLLLDGLTRALLAMMFNEITPNDSSGKRSIQLSRAEMKCCIDFADANRDEPLQVTRWAAAIGLSAGEFSRRFRATTGLSPYRWFLDWRLERARDLIGRNDLSLSQIAVSLGFAHQSHFTEAFRRHFGLTPIRWKRHRKA